MCISNHKTHIHIAFIKHFMFDCWFILFCSEFLFLYFIYIIVLLVLILYIEFNNFTLLCVLLFLVGVSLWFSFSCQLQNGNVFVFNIIASYTMYIHNIQHIYLYFPYCCSILVFIWNYKSVMHKQHDIIHIHLFR